MGRESDSWISWADAFIAFAVDYSQIHTKLCKGTSIKDDQFFL